MTKKYMVSVAYKTNKGTEYLTTLLVFNTKKPQFSILENHISGLVNTTSFAILNLQEVDFDPEHTTSVSAIEAVNVADTIAEDIKNSPALGGESTDAIDSFIEDFLKE